MDRQNPNKEDNWRWVGEYKRLCKIADHIHDKTRKVVDKHLKPNYVLIDSGEMNYDQKNLAKSMQGMMITDHAEQYLAGLITKEEFISLCKQTNLDNFQIVKLLKDLDEMKVM